MFLAGDRLEHREKRINDFLNREPAIAILLKLVGCHGLDAYKRFWREEVVSTHHPERLVEVIGDWEALRAAYAMRGGLIHGKTTCTRNTATPNVTVLLSATRRIAEYFERRGANINDRILVRRKTRGA
jgi:hypothetical protein